jgi:hypothetical protein
MAYITTTFAYDDTGIRAFGFNCLIPKVLTNRPQQPSTILLWLLCKSQRKSCTALFLPIPSLIRWAMDFVTRVEGWIANWSKDGESELCVTVCLFFVAPKPDALDSQVEISSFHLTRILPTLFAQRLSRPPTMPCFCLSSQPGSPSRMP